MVSNQQLPVTSQKIMVSCISPQLLIKNVSIIDELNMFCSLFVFVLGVLLRIPRSECSLFYTL